MYSSARTRTRVMIVGAAVVALVGGGVAPASAVVAALEYEAEAAVLFGGAGVNDNHLGYSGAGFVDGFVLDHQGEAGVTFDVDVPEAASTDSTSATRTASART